jgi:hypothetical protein
MRQPEVTLQLGCNYVAVLPTPAVELNHNNSRPKMTTMAHERVWVGVHGDIEGIVFPGNTLHISTYADKKL